MKRMALFGGTFNPVHKGHMENAEHVLNEFHLDLVLFVPSRKPVHKRMEYDPGPDHRYRMLAIAVSERACMDVSRIELDRTEESYTVYTARQIRETYGTDELFFILGTDSFNTLDQWKHYDELKHLLSFIVITRPGEEVDPSLMEEIPRVHISTNSDIDISSTKLRRMLRQKKDCTRYMDDAVLDYINREELYTQ
ncbi:MAG: nicotinate-nucleotide adenylyltransferase [Spirochaetota bacterium]